MRERYDILWDVLAKEFVKAPSSINEWKSIKGLLFEVELTQLYRYVIAIALNKKLYSYFFAYSLLL